jgi:hypothetical protein
MIQRIPNDPVRNHDSSFEHLLVAAIVHVGKERGDALVEAWHKGGWDVVFQIEGIDVPLKDIMDEWEKQLDRMLAEKAAEIAEEKTGAFFDVLEDAKKAFLRKIEAALGVKVGRED